MEILVVISILSILAAILLSVVMNAKASAKNTACRTNLSQIGQALSLYAADYDDCAPPYLTFWHTDQNDTAAMNWKRCLERYKAADAQFYCPFDRYAGTRTGMQSIRYNHLATSYDNTFNLLSVFHVDSKDEHSYSLGAVEDTSKEFYCADGQVGIVVSDEGTRARNSHGLGVGNVLYLDGHVKWYDLGWR